MHLPLFCTMGVWQASGTGLSIILSHGTTNSGTCDPLTSSNTSQWVLICSRCLWARSNNTALAPGRASCCCFCGEGGKEGKELTALKREGLLSYLCKPHPPNSCNGSPSVSLSLEDTSSPYSAPREKAEPPLAQGEEQRETAYLK